MKCKYKTHKFHIGQNALYLRNDEKGLPGIKCHILESYHGGTTKCYNIQYDEFSSIHVVSGVCEVDLSEV